MTHPLASADLEIPLAAGNADFAGVWTEAALPQPELAESSHDLPAGFAESAAAQIFKTAGEIDKFFSQKAGAAFIPWFNAEIGDRDAFRGKKIVGAQLQQRFESFWNGYTAAGAVSLIEFLAYMCIFINERGGELVSKAEAYGAAKQGHPGISYLFDSYQVVTADGRSFHKASYNREPNKTAGALFRDPDFNAAHGAKPLSSQLKNSQDPAWIGQTYPQDSFPTSGDPAVAGYILETDFFKFRGRGLIQTTWRSHYAALVESIQAYTGANPVILSYKRKWTDMTPDKACTMSAGSDWEALFNDTGNEIVSTAIRLHASAGKYLPLSADSAGLNSVGKGSLVFFGNSIGGGSAYGHTVKARVRQIALALQ